MNNNYIIENNIDFYEELKKCQTSKIKLEEKICLLSHEPLTDNYITFPCNHTFNYIPLCKDIISSKYAYLKYKNCRPTNTKSISCPYCRKQSDKLLPFIPIYGLQNNEIFSFKNSLDLYECTHINKSGKYKGIKCPCKNAFKSKWGIYCIKHYSKINQKYINKLSNEKILENKEAKIYLKKKKKELQDLLRSKELPISGTKIVLVNRLLNNNVI